MDQRWVDVDRWFEGVLGGAAAPARIAAAGEAAGLPPIAVSPSQGRLLELLVLTSGARRVLEVGTLGGYSSAWMAGALPPGGRLLTIELEADRADLARSLLTEEGLCPPVEVVAGDAVERLDRLVATGDDGWDLVFIDADKRRNPELVERVMHLVHPGSLLVVDNVVRDGHVVDGAGEDPSVVGVRRMTERIAADGRLLAGVTQTVGEKGWDGFLLARVR